MGHDGYAALDQVVDGLGHALATFQLHRAAVGLLHDAGRIAEGDGRTFLIAAERHVDDDQGSVRAAHHRLAVHDHQLERHRHGRFKAVHDHAERVADEQEVAVLVGNRGGMGVIGGERDNRLTSFSRGDLRCRDAANGFLDGHGASLPR